MKDQKEFRKRMALRVLSKPSSLYPFSGGLSLILIQWGLDLMLPLLNFVGIAGIIAGLASLVMNFVDLDKTAGEVYEEMNTDTRKQEEMSLNELEQLLAADGDPRTEELFNDLRTVYEKFVAIATDGSTNAESAQAIMAKIQLIFQTSISKFRMTLKMNNESRIATKNLKKTILSEREDIIREIIDSIGTLNEIVFNFNKYKQSSEGTQDLNKLTRELQQEIEIAKKADEWTKDMLEKSFDRDKD